MVTVLALICEEKIMGKGFTLWFCLRRSYDERYFTQVTILTYLLKSLRREGEKGKRARQPDYRNKRHEKRGKTTKWEGKDTDFVLFDYKEKEIIF